jgi:hypothetical protein
MIQYRVPASLSGVSLAFTGPASAPLSTGVCLPGELSVGFSFEVTLLTLPD